MNSKETSDCRKTTLVLALHTSSIGDRSGWYEKEYGGAKDALCTITIYI